MKGTALQDIRQGSGFRPPAFASRPLPRRGSEGQGFLHPLPWWRKGRPLCRSVQAPCVRRPMRLRPPQSIRFAAWRAYACLCSRAKAASPHRAARHPPCQRGLYTHPLCLRCRNAAARRPQNNSPRQSAYPLPSPLICASQAPISWKNCSLYTYSRPWNGV